MAVTTQPGGAPRLVAGRYRLGAVLGRGAMGTVWSAHDEVLGRAVAVKEVLLPPGIPDAEADLLRERSLREARAIAALSHPNVVTLYDVARDGGVPFVVMELVASDSLAELLRTGPLPADQVTAIGAAVAAALQAAHAASITHRDVKPGNVLVAHDGRIKLTDFGIARNPADQTMTATGLMLGSPAYIAPEVASGAPVSPAADLWGLGATLFAAVEGRPPYDAGDPLATVSSVVLDEVPTPSCSGPLAEVIGGLMVKDPAQRMPLPEVRRRLGSPRVTEPVLLSGQTGSSAAGHPPSPSAPSPSAPSPAPRPAAPLSVFPPPASPAGQLAAQPGPLPFAVRADREGHGGIPSDSPGRTTRRRISHHQRGTLAVAVLWTLAGLLFLGAATAGFAAARILSGAPALPALRVRVDTHDGAVLTTRVLTVTEADGSQPGRLTVAVPEGWLEFRDQAGVGDARGPVLRFVSPDGVELIAVQRSTGFLSRHRAEDYLAGYRHELAAVLPGLAQVRPEQRSGDGLVATFRLDEGRGADGERHRISYLRLVPAGADLWVIQVTVPTKREGIGRTELFEPVVRGFEPES